MQTYHWVCLAFLALAVPLLIRAVPPNRFYGVRTERTLNDREAWYHVNWIAGLDLLISAGFILIASYFLGGLHPAVLVLAVLGAVGHSYWAARRV